MKKPELKIDIQDRYVRQDGRVLLTGIQALIRLLIDQANADRREGLTTAGFVSGYRGSPLSGFDQQLERSKPLLDSLNIVVRPGVNEELAATAVWGSQQNALDSKSTVDGVFGLWYGKAPGLDRSGDAFKHGNLSGTAPHGGVLAVVGDDHRAKSSAWPCQSEFVFMDMEMPVLAPSSVQDVLDLGLMGYALSRWSGLWVGMIALADLMDATQSVSVNPNRLVIQRPDVPNPRLTEPLQRPSLLRHRVDAERLLREVKAPAVLEFARKNQLNRVIWRRSGDQYGVIAVGKAYADLLETFALLGLDEARAARLGIRLLKVSMPWPLEADTIRQFSEGLNSILVVENKRALVEPQLKEILFHIPQSDRPRIWGKRTPQGVDLLRTTLDLGPSEIVQALSIMIPALEKDAIKYEAMVRRIDVTASPIAVRAPHFCSGCPHNTSTKTPENARSIAGVGCHIMTEGMGRTTDGYTQMGGEGVPWLGQFPFTTEKHIFANLGDGTYFHSGILAIRAAVAVNAPITFKLLYNDAVAMTGGQKIDGPLDVPRLVDQLRAECVERIVITSDDMSRYKGVSLPRDVHVFDRSHILSIQRDLSQYPGVSVLIHDQVCATEKRRRIKRGLLPEATRRLYIHPRICESCGDCSVQSNCLSIEPVETPFGVKRQINQSSCNKDFRCGDGFCPSFVTVHDGALTQRRPELALQRLAETLPKPKLPVLNDAPFNLLITGVGGTGVTTLSAILAIAAHSEGKTVATLDMTGLAQKGGAVSSHIRIASSETRIVSSRISPGQADAVLACDMVTALTPEALQLFDPKYTTLIMNTDTASTSAFTLTGSLSFENKEIEEILKGNARRSSGYPATKVAELNLGDAIYSNMILLGALWQSGFFPVSIEAIEGAIRANGVAVEENIYAVALGRILIVSPEKILPNTVVRAKENLDEWMIFLTAELTAYQDTDYAARFVRLVKKAQAAMRIAEIQGEEFARAVAEEMFRLMAYKDEYEVARLYSSASFRDGLAHQFDRSVKVSVHLAPPFLSRIDPETGRPRKRAFGPWVFHLFHILQKFKGLRGSRFDPFGYSEERRMERRLVDDYEQAIQRVCRRLNADNCTLAVSIARSTDSIRGFGPIKRDTMIVGQRRIALLVEEFESCLATQKSRRHQKEKEACNVL